ncbi:MAG: XrtA/PEP-CTERM system TPR-repeat protein PrsT [Vitreoscilla sp.]
MKNTAAAATFALLVSSGLVGCGNDSPQALIAAAKSSMAKNDDKTALVQVKNALQADPNSGEARFLLGSVLLDQGDFVAADLELQKAKALHYSPDLLTPKLAAVLLAQSQYKKLTDEYSKTRLGTNAANADLETSLAYAYAMQGQIESSDATLKSALAAAPDFEPALVAQARFVARAGDPDGALALAGKVLQHNPRSVEALRLQGDIHMYLKSQPDLALADYRKALAVDPKSTPAHLAILSILMSQHKADEAEKQLAEMRKVTGNTAQAIYIEALIAYARKNTEKAHQLTAQLLKLAPDSPSILLLAGGVELQSGSLLQAETYLEHAAKLAPDALTARRMLITAYLRSNQPERALAALLPGQTKGPVPPELYSTAAEVYLQNGDVRTAEEYFEKAAKQDPTDAGARTSLALAHMVGGQAPLAFEELQGIAASDKGTSADLALISAYMKRGDHDSALRAVDALEHKQPGRPLATDLRGRIQLSMKDTAGARRSFEKALIIAPTYYPAVASLAALDAKEDKLVDARKRLEAFSASNPKSSAPLIALALVPGTSSEASAEYLKKAIAASPTLADPRLLLIRLYLTDKNLRLAGTAAQDAAAVLPSQPEILDALGQVQLQSGGLNQAVTTFAKVVELTPGQPQPLVRLAEAQLQAGNKDSASETLRKVLVIKPDLVEAQRRLAVIDASIGNFPDAFDIAHTMQRQRPSEAVGYTLEGDLDASRRDWDKAASAYRTGIRQQPSAELAVKLHSVLLASGADAQAQAFETGWRKDHPDDSIFVFHVGDAALARKDYASAESAYAAVLKVQPANAAAYNNLAWVASLQNKPSALAYAEKANELAPNQPAFMDTLASILGATGQVDKALVLQKKVVAMVPANNGFKLDLARLYVKAGNKTDARAELDELAALGKKFPGQAEVVSLRKSL